ncbi:hypothetical protein ElyMa_000418100 [Elysia marginata]|uniref:Uncharacterized protein n=1 Tax=Elysia marginata TaxID=1093978 RepID=A0AAV4FLT2_9GAST|nr:hypothetical protein ElyMa_000418100 [Elysia marginata]
MPYILCVCTGPVRVSAGFPQTPSVPGHVTPGELLLGELGRPVLLVRGLGNNFYWTAAHTYTAVKPSHAHSQEVRLHIERKNNPDLEPGYMELVSLGRQCVYTNEDTKKPPLLEILFQDCQGALGDPRTSSGYWSQKGLQCLLESGTFKRFGQKKTWKMKKFLTTRYRPAENRARTLNISLRKPSVYHHTKTQQKYG